MSFGDGCGDGCGAFCEAICDDACSGAIFDDACERLCSIAVTSCANIIIVGNDLNGNLMQLFERK